MRTKKKKKRRGTLLFFSVLDTFAGPFSDLLAKTLKYKNKGQPLFVAFSPPHLRWEWGKMLDMAHAFSFRLEGTIEKRAAHVERKKEKVQPVAKWFVLW